VRREVRLWDADAAGSSANTPLVLADRVWSVAFSPDGQTLLTGIERRRAEFWDLATGKPRLPPIEHERGVYAVAYSPDGRSVLTGSEDMTAKLWDAVTHRPLGVTLQHHGTVYAVAFRPPDGGMILTGSGDRTARLWDAATGRPLGEPFEHPRPGAGRGVQPGRAHVRDRLRRRTGTSLGRQDRPPARSPGQASRPRPCPWRWAPARGNPARMNRDAGSCSPGART